MKAWVSGGKDLGAGNRIRIHFGHFREDSRCDGVFLGLAYGYTVYLVISCYIDI
jgi:hypothetical protein